MIARTVAATSLVLTLIASGAAAQTGRTPKPAAHDAGAAPVVTPPPDYVVGAEDVLSIVFWHESEMSADAVVRPDGKISLQLLNEITVAGLTPDQIRQEIDTDAKKYFDDPSATVIVKQINSRKIYITGNVERPGMFPLLRDTSVLQLIALAGGLKEFAKAGDITVIRNEPSGQVSYLFNYDEVKNRKNLAQNILLKPGDTVIVP